MTGFTGKVNCTCGKEMSGGGGQVGGTLSCTYRTCECGIGAIFYTIPKSSTLSFKVERDDQVEINEETKEKLLSVFKLAGIKIIKSYDIINSYSSGLPYHVLAITPLGNITIGWRKRVISIDWSDTKIEMLISDDVTKEKFMCHAWSYAKAVDYMEQLVNQSELIIDCDELIPDGVILCDENEKPLYTVVSSYSIGEDIGYGHEVKEIPAYPIPVKPLFKSKLAEELEAIETDLSNDGPPEEPFYESEPTFDEQIESDLELYGNAFWTTDEDGDKTRINPLTVTTLKRTRRNG